MLFPFYWMAITSIKPNRELYNAKIMPLIVHQPVLKHYVDLLDQTNFLTWTYNTMLVVVVTTVVSLVLGTMLAYPLARLNFPGAAIVAIGVAATSLTAADPVLRLAADGLLLIFLTTSEVRTVPVGAITELIRGDVFYWGQLMAAALLGSVPVAVIYSFFVEHYVAGLTAGSVKN
jgi:ABC-type glycerol-3-phosphate transport system permease component